MSSTNGKPIRFASLVRVSTEQQEKTGESLRTQRTQNDQNVRLLGGTIVDSYGGQEHATPGHEKKELNRLIADAKRGKFDAVVVSNADRWSRDNGKSREGIEVFKTCKVRFFVGVSEYDLFNPEHLLFLNMSSVFGEFNASQQRKKSVLNRIERARRGCPSAGKIPYGRTFGKDGEKWGIDPKKQQLIEDVARRYLAGEPLPKLATEYQMNHSQLCLTLRERCGDQWTIEFDQPDLNIRETVTITVPRLLPEETIRLVKHKLEANRTFIRSGGRRVHEYLLSGRIFCAACGFSLCGSTDRHGTRHYNHTHAGKALDCPVMPRPWVRADKIEEEVVSQLFDMFGNPSAIQRAMQAAVPDCDRELKRRSKLETDLAELGRARDRVMDRIVRGLITDEQADKTLQGLKDREGTLRVELDKLALTLANVPTQEAMQVYVDRIDDFIFVHDKDGEMLEGGNEVGTWVNMTPEDHRNLIHAVFNTPLADGTPAGVYVSPAGGSKKYQRKKWTFKIRGRLEFELVMRRGCRFGTTPHTNPPAFVLTGEAG